jgi:4-amino-4-deoxychorismate lyase
MRDTDGYVIEGTMSNLFMVRDRVLITPDLDKAGIRGITRDVLLEIAAGSGIACQPGNVLLPELFDADELFVCNSLIGVWPVSRLEDHTIAVGDITRQLQQALKEAMC